MNEKIILLDIDGTLTEPGYNIPPASALDAIKKAQSNGHKVFLCTGRNLAMLRPLLQYNFDGYVASAGGYVVCDGNVVFDRPMKPEVFRLAMDVFGRNHVFRTVECLNGTYGDNGLEDLLEGADEFSNSELLRFRRQLSETLDIGSMSEYDGAPVYKIVFMCTERSQLDEPLELLKDYFVFCVQNLESLGCLNGEVFGLDFNKGIGIRRLCDYLDRDISDTIGFGDSMNDKEMFDAVGYSVCMENGHPEMKKIADYVCPSVSDDGLYKAFEKLGLI